MRPIKSMATPRSASTSFAAVAAFATLMGMSALASGQEPETCPPEHRKVDNKIHDRLHRALRDRQPLERRSAESEQFALEHPERQRVIIRAKAGMRAVLETAGRNRGHNIRADHGFINAFSADLDENDLARLAADPRVESVSFDEMMHGDQAVLDDPLTSIGTRTMRDQTRTPPNPAALRGTLGLNGSTWTGSGITVALIDSGLEPSADFIGRIKAFYDFTRPGAPAATPSDGYGHGTHIAGLIGAAGRLSGGASYMGIAPRVDFVVLKVLDSQGVGSTSNVISAIQFATAHKASLGINIINLSLGHAIYEPAATDPLVQAVQAASRAGLVVVVSAGNYGTNTATGRVGYAGITSPGNAPAAITVGAVSARDTVARGDDRMATYSSRGPTWYDGMAKPDVVATGSQLASNAARKGTLYANYPALVVGSDYIKLSGTSMAAGVVSGVVALMLEANQSLMGPRRLTSNAVKAALEFSAIPVFDDAGAAYDNLTQGAGEVNGQGAVQLARAIDPPRASTTSGSGRRSRR